MKQMTLDEARQAIADICDKQLYGARFVASLGPGRVAAACNGCGPASWPEERREKLDKWLKTFRLAFDVHDCRFTWDNCGSLLAFREANIELRENCLILADEKYSWYNPLRYFARNRAYLIGLLCQEFGWKAWMDACNKSHNQKQKKTERIEL